MSTSTFERPSLTDIAYEEIKKSICLGEFSPGYKLIVDDLVRAYKISNTPIKEALNRLAAEGLVEAVPRRGMQVKKIGKKEIIELNDLRLMYELHCAKKALDVIDDREDIKAKLTANICSFERLTENPCSYEDYINHTEVDIEFHMTIISLAGNDILVKEYEKLNAITMTNNNYAYRNLPLRRCKEALKEHRSIYEALMKKDSDMLMDSIEIHITNVRNDMLSFLNNNE